MTEHTLRGGMIGAGAWAANQLEAWQHVEGARVVALCDRHPERLLPMAERFGISRVYADLQQMIAGDELDFIDVCTRPYSHATLTRMALAKGLPVLCQKPFCTSMQEAISVMEDFRKAKVRLMINENFRWQAWYRKIKQLLQAGTVGEPYFAKIQERVRATLPNFQNAQAYLAEMPRLILYEMGTHYLDTLRFLFGEPESLICQLHKISPRITGEDVQVMLLIFKTLTVVIESSWVSVPIPGIDSPIDGSEPLIARLEIDGPQGTISLGPDGSLQLFRDDEWETWSFPKTTEADSRAAAQQHFIDCLTSGEHFETSAEETLKTMALVWSGYQSAESGKLVYPGSLLPQQTFAKG